MERNGIEYNIVKEYPNGVRVGNIPTHKNKFKKTGTIMPDNSRQPWRLVMINKVKIKELIASEDETIEFINNCNEHDIYWLSEIFEDISEIFQSQKFIEALKNVQAKYPNLDLETDIMFAEKALG